MCGSTLTYQPFLFWILVCDRIPCFCRNFQILLSGQDWEKVFLNCCSCQRNSLDLWPAVLYHLLSCTPFVYSLGILFGIELVFCCSVCFQWNVPYCILCYIAPNKQVVFVLNYKERQFSWQCRWIQLNCSAPFIITCLWISGLLRISKRRVVQKLYAEF